MPAPSAPFLTAIRGGSAERHLFMRLDHSQGVLRYWTGLGPFTFLGETFHGIAGLARLSGVSDSADVQQHEIAVTLNAVPLSALTDVDQSIRGKAADVWAVWIDASGAVVHSLNVFSGVGNRIGIKPGDTEYAIEAKLKARLANWLARGDRFYSSVDQSRLFSADTGFSLVPGLQNATLTGWQRTAAVATDLVYLVSSFGGTFVHIADANGDIMGLETSGAYFYNSAGYLSTLDAVLYLREEVGLNWVFWSSVGAPITCAGANVSINGSGFAQSVNGNLIRTDDDTQRVRRQAAITSTGSALAEGVTWQPIYGITYLCRAAGAASGGNFSGLVYSDNAAYRFVVGSAYTMHVSGADRTVHDIWCYTNSGTYVGRAKCQGISGTTYKVVYAPFIGQLIVAEVSGATHIPHPISVTTTGAIAATISSTLYRIIPENEDTTAFMRVWK